MRILRAAIEKKLVIKKKTVIILSIDFSAETLKAMMEWDNIFKVLKQTNQPTRKHTTKNVLSTKAVLQK